MTGALRVLSIDWDYFIKATAAPRAEMFPDGGNENLSSFLADYVWAGRYACYPELIKVKSDKAAIEAVEHFILCHEHADTKVMIADSHKHIYDFIRDHLGEGQKVEVLNYDFHHDCYDGIGDPDEVTCGNWVTQMFMEGKNQLAEGSCFWVKRDDSDIHEDFADYAKYGWVTQIHEGDPKMDYFEDWDIDLIFICRSGMWSPPHLDEDFIEFCYDAMESLETVGQHGILETRYHEDFQELVQLQANQLADVLKMMDK